MERASLPSSLFPCRHPRPDGRPGRDHGRAAKARARCTQGRSGEHEPRPVPPPTSSPQAASRGTRAREVRGVVPSIIWDINRMEPSNVHSHLYNNIHINIYGEYIAPRAFRPQIGRTVGCGCALLCGLWANFGRTSSHIAPRTSVACGLLQQCISVCNAHTSLKERLSCSTVYRFHRVLRGFTRYRYRYRYGTVPVVLIIIL